MTATLAAAPLCANADTVVHNVTGYDVTAEGVRRFAALCFDDSGRVVATGAADAWKDDPDLRRLDGHGATLLPGLIDAHGHVLGLGHARRQVDLTSARSAAEAVALVAQHARAHPELTWILGRGWNQELWEDRGFPTAAQLDAAVGDRPVWL